jgi:hypothetical protein
MDHLPGWGEIAPWAMAGAAGMMGRLMFHAKQVQAGRRKPLSWTLLWDIPIALGMGWSALGVCTWRGAPYELMISVALLASYLGPWTLDLVVAKAADKYFGRRR